MHEDASFEKLLQHFEPMIYHAIHRLAIYKNEQEFYQIGCIALWDASLRFNNKKGNFKSYAYSYIIGRMKRALTEERKRLKKESLIEEALVTEEKSNDDFAAILTESLIEKVSPLLTENQNKWVKAYYFYGKTPTEIAEDEGVSAAAVKAWRRDAIANLRKYF